MFGPASPIPTPCLMLKNSECPWPRAGRCLPCPGRCCCASGGGRPVPCVPMLPCRCRTAHPATPALPLCSPRRAPPAARAAAARSVHRCRQGRPVVAAGRDGGRAGRGGQVWAGAALLPGPQRPQREWRSLYGYHRQQWYNSPLPSPPLPHSPRQPTGCAAPAQHRGAAPRWRAPRWRLRGSRWALLAVVRRGLVRPPCSGLMRRARLCHCAQGNVYVKFATVQAAEAAMRAFHGRYYSGAGWSRRGWGGRRAW